ncbi:MAG: hypothetical protein RI564_01105, partial [Gracilimonas sp.]|nr:hypothetical protein [Gracilimonas sp.]
MKRTILTILMLAFTTLAFAQSAPAGFVANDGNNPGEVFLAVGPNDVALDSIEYKLFYSETASAPADPLTATEYTFGSIAGDGDGNAAFGFDLGGLTEGTDYTFWLYQFNNVDSVYSDPASDTAVSGSTTVPSDAAPTTNAAEPEARDAANVVSIYGDFYDTIDGVNYNPNWGQSGFADVDPAFDPGTGNPVLAYPNFNYQGTEFGAQDLSDMDFVHIDIWVAEGTDRMVKFTPIDATGEVLVEVPVTPGSWNSVDLPKSAFAGMNWEAVSQLKFDGQFNADGSANTTSFNVYVDNIFFYKAEDMGAAPAAPAGFVANDGNNPGEVFLAVGPNDVALDSIEYKLFYSETASAPADPLTATEYTFGSIAGDGDGNAAFGFNLGGLTEGTDYTFWLYQFNNVDSVYSDPASDTAVSGSTTVPSDAAPTTNAAEPEARDAANVVSIYGDFYDTIDGVNYNPNWGQSGFADVDPAFDPGTGNPVLAYPNFNYQGTEFGAQDLSDMDFVHIDIWVAEGTDRMVKFTPIDATGEVLVEVPVTPGSWNSVDLPKSAFAGMNWEAVSQLKFDGQFNADGSANTTSFNVYVDNIFFYKAEDMDAAPAAPAGFVANDGNNPGEVFLAVGPNDVAL